MSLVDYASSDEDDNAEVREEENHISEVAVDYSDVPKDDPPSQSPPLPQKQRSGLSSSLQTESSSNQSSSQSEPSMLKLPDASVLLNSPAISSHLASSADHSSRVAAAMAEHASRKRESNGSASVYSRSKIPRGTLPHSRSIPDTGGGLLLPPQLSGRSNIVTEDISKLFATRHADPSSQ